MRVRVRVRVRIRVRAKVRVRVRVKVSSFCTVLVLFWEGVSVWFGRSVTPYSCPPNPKT